MIDKSRSLTGISLGNPLSGSSRRLRRSASFDLDDLHIFYLGRNLDAVVGHVEDDVVLPHPDTGHARKVRELVTVRIPHLGDTVEMLVCFPEISVIYRA